MGKTISIIGGTLAVLLILWGAAERFLGVETTAKSNATVNVKQDATDAELGAGVEFNNAWIRGYEEKREAKTRGIALGAQRTIKRLCEEGQLEGLECGP